ncbi:hypothetical protein BC629DRAFT_1595546 [Irpex lacteus]|nr:hypothetical protein BC629DRAFT_1595546 [Irpex lacteus]
MDSSRAIAPPTLDFEIRRRRESNRRLLPVSLPDPALLEIFLFCQPQWPHDWSKRPQHRPFTWIKVAHVCHVWREVVVQQPTLWNRISWNYGSIERCSTMIERAGCLPLDIEIHRLKDGTTNDILRLISAQRHRIRGLKIDEALSLVDITYLCDMITPIDVCSSINHLSLNLEYAGSPSASLDHMLPHPPLLQSLRLSGFHMSPSWPGFGSTLTELSIELGTHSVGSQEDTLSHRGCISATTMLSILARCTSLQVLRLHYVLDNTRPTTRSCEDNDGIYLPSLQSLHLADYEVRLSWLFCQLRYRSETIAHFEVIAGTLNGDLGEDLANRLTSQFGRERSIQAAHLQIVDWEPDRPALVLSCWPYPTLSPPPVWTPFRRHSIEMEPYYPVQPKDFHDPPRFQLTLIMYNHIPFMQPMAEFLEVLNYDGVLDTVDYFGMDICCSKLRDLEESLRPILGHMRNATILDVSRGIHQGFYDMLRPQAGSVWGYGARHRNVFTLLPNLRRVNVPINPCWDSTQGFSKELKAVRELISVRNEQGRLLGGSGISEVWFKDEENDGNRSFEKFRSSSEYAEMRELYIACKYWDAQTNKVRNMH